MTRARSGAWLDLISPLTEWAGLKGDALRYRRNQLRIQQEAALEKLASNVRLRMRGKVGQQYLPAKIIVPALEKASLEEPESPLIAWWADLLVSGATEIPIRPFLVDLMSKLGEEGARLLEGRSSSRRVLKSRIGSWDLLMGSMKVQLRAQRRISIPKRPMSCALGWPKAPSSTLSKMAACSTWTCFCPRVWSIGVRHLWTNMQRRSMSVFL